MIHNLSSMRGVDPPDDAQVQEYALTNNLNVTEPWVRR